MGFFFLIFYLMNQDFIKQQLHNTTCFLHDNISQQNKKDNYITQKNQRLYN